MRKTISREGGLVNRKNLAAGKTYAGITGDYPEVEEDDIRQYIECAACLASEKNVAISGSHK